MFSRIKPGLSFAVKYKTTLLKKSEMTHDLIMKCYGLHFERTNYTEASAMPIYFL